MSASVFPRISPDHVLCESARQTNDYADKHDLPETLEWLGIDVDEGELAYLCEQRALRAMAAATMGVALGENEDFDETICDAIVRTPLWRDMRSLLIASTMDGITIGWRARELRDEPRT